MSQSEEPLTTAGLMREITVLKEKFKGEDEETYSPYADLEKATVLQECRIFHDSKAVRESPRKCCTTITKLLYIVAQGESLTSAELIDVFFGVTKLFQSKDASLRRMVYLFIKEVAESCDRGDVIIVTQSLTKDMNSDTDLYRSNAIRVLARIVDAGMLGAIERYIKQAIVDRHPLVSSSALISASHFFESSPESANIVRRWLNEAQTALQSPHEMVQYHALSLLYQIKKHDRLGVSKLVTQLSKNGSLKSPLATISLIRYTSKLMHDEARENSGVSDGSSELARAGYSFLEGSLRHRNEMVIYEAARAICNLPGVEPQDLAPGVTVLQLFLSSPRPTVRYAAMKTLSEVAMIAPMAVVKCNEDIEVLISDTNRSIATLAITTLLKTGSESSVDRLMKQISSFMNDIQDEFKIIIVKAVKDLVMKYPGKQRILIGFLSNILREEGGFEFKKSIVNAIMFLMDAIPETKENGLIQLCEFIEDSDFTALSTIILHMIGNLGPDTPNPARYIRFIYNRVILENSQVRAAAVTALAKFGAKVPSLRESILTLLQRSLADEDDEVRDRSNIAVDVLKRAIAENDYSALDENGDPAPDVPTSSDSAAFLLLEPLPMSFSQLERSLKQYSSAPGALESAEPLSFNTLPVVEEVVEVAPVQDSNGSSNIMGASSPLASSAAAPPAADPAADIYAIPELAHLGRVFRSSPPVEQTESETEYVVKCIKHIFNEHVVLQFKVQNTVDSQRLDNVTMALEGESEILTVSGEIACESIPYGEAGSCFTVLDRDVSVGIAPSAFTCELHFTAVGVDPMSGEEEGDSYEEEYAVEDLEIATSDFIAKVNLGNFRNSWEQMGNECEVLEKFALSFKSTEEAVENVINYFGMSACDGTATVKNPSKPHMLHLSGVFVGSKPVMVRAQVGKTADGVVLKVAVRSEDADVSRQVADCIR
ncbi:hypothetical protein TrST_g5707 [Triparma strigata]|uniref:Coatomer subunit gamma n=1 Tax=Triparma strigata TaxID=1606541 RepID=A0A9W7ASJ4_9STRA|nr:hypothetical protein TrST_g5707 [Triparma strigata]